MAARYILLGGRGCFNVIVGLMGMYFLVLAGFKAGLFFQTRNWPVVDGVFVERKMATETHRVGRMGFPQFVTAYTLVETFRIAEKERDRFVVTRDHVSIVPWMIKGRQQWREQSLPRGVSQKIRIYPGEGVGEATAVTNVWEFLSSSIGFYAIGLLACAGWLIYEAFRSIHVASPTPREI